MRYSSVAMYFKTEKDLDKNKEKSIKRMTGILKDWSLEKNGVFIEKDIGISQIYRLPDFDDPDSFSHWELQVSMRKGE